MAILPLNVVVGNKYRIEQLVGAGGMGEVYRATDLQKRLPVAVKILTQSGDSNTAMARFRNEAVIQYNLNHPNVAELYEYFEHQGKPCIAMEYVEGRSVSDWVGEAGALDTKVALEIMADICDAVSYMHSKGIIHRDIKSDNIKITTSGRAKLLDFGISVSKDTPFLTKLGYYIGTPQYMAPEQHTGARGDARSDVWALGVLLYEMTTGSQPFSNRNADALRSDILAVRYIPAAKRKPGLPKPVVRLVTSCLRFKEDDRFASSGVMLRELQQVRRGLATEKFKQVLFSKEAAVAITLALLVCLLMFYAFQPTPAVEITSERKGYTKPSPAVPDAGVTTRPIRDPEYKETRQAYSSVSETGPSRKSPPAPLPDPVALPTLHGQSTHSDPNSADKRTVQVATYDGTAEVVNKDGKVLGSTPFPLTGTLNERYELWLRRPGFQLRKIDVQINNNQKEFLFGLEKNESKPEFGYKD